MATVRRPRAGAARAGPGGPGAGPGAGPDLQVVTVVANQGP